MAIGSAATIPAIGLSRQCECVDPRVSLRSWQSHWATAQLRGPFQGVEIHIFSVLGISSVMSLVTPPKNLCKFTPDKCFLYIIYINFLSTSSLPPPNMCNWFKRRGLLKTGMKLMSPECGDWRWDHTSAPGCSMTPIWQEARSGWSDTQKFWFPTSKGTTSTLQSLLAISQPWKNTWAMTKIPQPFSELGVLSSVKASSNKWQGKVTSENRWHKLREWDLPFYPIHVNFYVISISSLFR